MADLAETVAHYLRGLKRPSSAWRIRARVAILAALDSTPPGSDAAEILGRIDAAYPFGPRKHHPYKAWLAERRLVVDLLTEAPRTAEEWGVVEVAMDMLEDAHHRAEDGADAISAELRSAVLALLDEQAPQRHARRCPTCNAGRRSACREPVESLVGGGGTWTNYVDRLIPHAARCQP